MSTQNPPEAVQGIIVACDDNILEDESLNFISKKLGKGTKAKRCIGIFDFAHGDEDG